jgi:hypothetical protein
MAGKAILLTILLTGRGEPVAIGGLHGTSGTSAGRVYRLGWVGCVQILSPLPPAGQVHPRWTRLRLIGAR